MKKNLFIVAALATLLSAVSCQKEFGAVAEGEGNVTFTLQTPGVDTKAIADGTNVDIVYYEIYRNEEGHKNSLTGDPLVTGNVPMQGKEATLTLNLLQGQDYVGLFWAQVDGNDYYNVENLRNVQVSYPNSENDKTYANDEARAAFCQVYEFDTKEVRSETVTLVRPFAQINLGTSLESLDMDYEINLEESSMTVYGVSNSFNVAAMTAGTQTTDVVFSSYAVPYPDETLSANDETWAYAGMNYVLVPGDDAATVKVDYSIKTDVGTLSRTVESVPVRMNYRTNLLGNLLTQETTIQIVVDENFNDKDMEGGKYGVLDGKKYIKVESTEEFNEAIADTDYDMVILLADVELTAVVTRAEADPSIVIRKNKSYVLDLNGYTLSASSAQTGKNYNMFDVNGGTLTVKNGTLEYIHEGNNMGWNNSTNLFNITAGGVLNLEGVTAKNLGGSDMAFVAHLNNWGEATLNVDNSILESTYIAVRAFNSGYDMNNITIKNSTLKGKYCFWVHNYKGAGDSAGTDATLNLDICNGTNTFVYTGKAPILYGFNNPLYYDANGAEVVFDAETLAARLTSDVENIAIALGNDIDLPIASLGQQTGGSGEYKLGGENTKNITVDLNDNKLNITTTYWSVLGAKNDDAVFTIKNGTMTSSQATGTWNSYDLCFANCNYVIEDVDFEKAIALEGKSFTLNDVTVKETHDYYAIWVSAKGQTINIDGLTVESAGRGIKIDEQYVSAPAKVVLNLNDAKFKTVKKAAVVVKSVAGAEINASDLDITEVAEDTKFAVWVDEDSKAYADKVVVNGAYVKIEGTQGIVVESAENLPSKIEENAAVYVAAGTYTFPTNVGAGATIVCAEGTVFNGTSSLNINGATVVGATFKNEDGKAVSGTINGTFKDCAFEGSEALRWCYTSAGTTSVFENCIIKTDFRGFHFDDMAGDVVFRNCEINGFNAFGGEGTITFEGCTFGNDESNYNGLNIYSNTLVKNSEFNFISGKTNFIDMEGSGKTLTIDNCTATLDGVPVQVSAFVGGSQLSNNTLVIK